MIEFVWVLVLVASLVGALRCRPTGETWQARLRGCLAQRWRWWLLVAALLVSAMVYLWENVLRALLNLLLFFEHHTAVMWVLLAASLLGFILSWRNALTPRRVAGVAALAVAVGLLLASGQDCLFYALAILTLFGLLFAQPAPLSRLLAWILVSVFALAALFVLNNPDNTPREHLFVVFAVAAAAAVLIWAYLPRGLLWTCVLLTTFLVAGLLLSRVIYGPLSAPFEPRDYLIMAIVIGLGALGLIWAIGARLPLLGWVSGLLLVVFVGGLIWTDVNARDAHANAKDLPAWFVWFTAVSDYILFVIFLGLAWSAVAWVRRLPMQPLGWVSAVMILFLGGGLFFSSILYGEPEDFADIEDQFKYGSIGSDHFMARGIPYYIWDILPEMFPPEDIIIDALPEEIRKTEESRYQPRYGTPKKTDGTSDPDKCRGKERDEAQCKGMSYEAFGVVKEPDKHVRLMAAQKDGLLESLAERLIDRDKDDVIVKVIDRPIGFSKRKVFGLDFVGINCAFCHVSTIRKDGPSKPQIILGMPANTTDIELFFQYLFGVAAKPALNSFPATEMLDRILEKHGDMKFGMQVAQFGVRGVCQEMKNSVHRFAYRLGLIPLTGLYARRLKHDFAFIDPHNPDRIPRFGPGRVDAWNPGKRTLVKPPLPVEYPGGIIDDTSIWNQKAREGLRLHWDGNIDVLAERNIIAGLVVNGPNIETLDTKRMDRINNWIEGRPAPRFDDFVPPDQIDQDYLVDHREQGRVIFQHWCAACHATGGERTGRVEPLDGGGIPLPGVNGATLQLDTDPARMLTFTAELAKALDTLGTDQWQLRHFKAQKGYVNMLLDGIWLRAPYLHNGSVPTLRDLLNKQEERPVRFCRGIDLYDWSNVGFVTTTDQPDCRGPNGARYFLFDTTVPGNSNRGHLYGTDLLANDKALLIEFLKTL